MRLFSGSEEPVVYIHIGMNKTGSTALQAWFLEHRKVLASDYGLLYPQCGFERGAHYGLSDMLGFAHVINKQTFTFPSYTLFRQRLSLEAHKVKCRSICFSSENFVINRDPAVVKALFKKYQCKIVVYLRRHDSWFESAYRQTVKMVRNPQYPPGVNAFIQRTCNRAINYTNYRILLDKWANVFGLDNIIVRPYEREQIPLGIVPDFLETIGHQGAKVLGNGNQNNRSLSKLSTQILETAQRAGLTDSEFDIVLKYVTTHDQIDDGHSFLPPKRRRKMVENYQNQYEYIAQNYLKRPDGRLFYAPIPLDDDPWIAFSSPPPHELVKPIIQAIREGRDC